MGFVNVEGIWNAINNGELLYISKSYDLLGLAETWWDGKTSIQIKGCTFIGKSRGKRYLKGRNPGGIGFLVKNEWERYIEVINTKHEEWLCIALTIEESKIYIIFGVIYQHPISSNLHNENLYVNLEEELYNIMGKYNNYELCLLGDFNARIGTRDVYDMDGQMNQITEGINYGNIQRSSKDKVVNKEGEKLLEFCVSNNLFIANGNLDNDMEGEYTFLNSCGASVIDYILMSNKLVGCTEEFRIIDIVSSTHMLLSIRYKFIDEQIVLKNKNVNLNIKKGRKEKIIWKEENREHCDKIIKEESTEIVGIGMLKYITEGDIEMAINMLHHMAFRIGFSSVQNENKRYKFF